MLTPSKLKYSSLTKYSIPEDVPTKKTNGYFLEKIKQREKDLRENQRKLALAKERFAKNVEMLEIEKNRVNACFDDVTDISPKIRTKRHQFQSAFSPGEDDLYQLADEIRQQLIFATRDLEETQQKMQKNNSGFSPVHDTKEIQGKKYIVGQFQKLLNKVNEQVVPKESEVADIENQALIHLQDQQIVEQRKQDSKKQAQYLQKRIKHAQKKLTTLQEQNQKVKECHEITKSSLKEAKETQELLRNKEIELQEMEQALREKRKQNQQLSERIQKLRKTTASLDNERRKISLRSPSQDFDDIETPTQQDVENFKKEVEKAQERLKQALQREETVNADTKAKAEIRNMRELIRVAKEENEKLNRISQMSMMGDQDDLKQQVADKVALVHDLQEQIVADEELEARDLLIRNEQKSVLTIERDVSTRSAELHNLEDEIEIDEIDIVQTEDELRREKQLMLTKLNNNKKMYDVSILQKKALEEMLEDLKKTYDMLVKEKTDNSSTKSSGG